ncbi:hypothetical protein M9C83_05645 [SAR86 cluster bacterium]|nr:hypothetical protein M9C83_05645 [SAR86 cluster bacterium]
MKQSLRQKQKLSVKITASLGNQIKLLSLSGFEISSKLNDLIEDYFDEDDKKIAHFKDEYLIDRYKNVLYQGNDYQNILSGELDSDIRQKLLQQLELTPFDEAENLIGEYLIDSVESNGRLDPEINYEDIKSIVFEDLQKNISDQDIDKVLQIIQNFEPPGCAFRNINESLFIQIENLELSNGEKITLKETLENLIDGKVEIHQLPHKIKKNLDKLSLNPTGSFGSTTQNYIRPDLVAIKDKNEWQVSLNDEFMSKELLEIVKSKVNSIENEKTISSKSFLNGLERRQQTLLVVSEFIVQAQKNFLNGKAGKRAISNKEIADKLELSTSTVSRIVRNKYIQLPDKVIPLIALLERRINKHKEGKDVTGEDLQILLGQIIQNEDKSNPLSDENLKFALKDNFGVILSRRTIAKYRLELQIPSSRERYFI